MFAVGIEAISALACYRNPGDYGAYSYAGFDGMGLAEGGKEEPYIFHFPDGNASVARLLVRSLVPGSIPGHTMEDVVTAPADYAKLDQASSRIRIRLNSTAVRARHRDAPDAKEVEVAFVQQGKLRSAKASACVLACYNGMVPYLCPELPEAQKEALHYGAKEPFIYTHVAIRNWAAFHKLGIRQIVAQVVITASPCWISPSAWVRTTSQALLRNRWCCSCCARRAGPVHRALLSVRKQISCATSRVTRFARRTAHQAQCLAHLAVR